MMKLFLTFCNNHIMMVLLHSFIVLSNTVICRITLDQHDFMDTSDAFAKDFIWAFSCVSGGKDGFYDYNIYESLFIFGRASLNIHFSYYLLRLEGVVVTTEEKERKIIHAQNINIISDKMIWNDNNAKKILLAQWFCTTKNVYIFSNGESFFSFFSHIRFEQIEWKYCAISR